MNNSFSNTKLRGTEKSRSHYQFQASYDEEPVVEPNVSGLQSPLNSQEEKKVSTC